MAGMMQKEYDIAKSKEISPKECSNKCLDNPECIGFDFDVKTKDCFLSKTSWRKARPEKVSDKITCEKKEGSLKIDSCFKDITSDFMLLVFNMISALLQSFEKRYLMNENPGILSFYKKVCVMNKK